MDHELLHLWLGMFPNLLNCVVSRIVDYFGGPEELWNASESVIRETLTEKQSQMILETRDEKKIMDYQKRLKDRNITYIYPGHPFFPKVLLDIPDCPRLLYAKGRLDLLVSDRIGMAIVGARKASVYGKEMTRRFSSELAGYQTNIISGLAAGIDGTAQQAALEVCDGFTVAVLGCGINICYPRENYQLYEKIGQRGVILSEYGLDVEPVAWRFPPRNRIISGLAKGVLVVEAQKKSGSLITADQALEQGREVYAVPGRIGDRNSEGCNQLIRQGAVLVTDPMDIVADLKLQKREASADKKKKNISTQFTWTEQMLYACMGTKLMHIEEICARIGQPPEVILTTLFDMERKGMIVQPQPYYFTTDQG